MRRYADTFEALWPFYLIAGVALAISTCVGEATPAHAQTLLDQDVCRPPGMVLADGLLSADIRDQDTVYADIGGVVVIARARGTAAMLLRDQDGVRGTLVFVPERKQR